MQFSDYREQQQMVKRGTPQSESTEAEQDGKYLYRVRLLKSFSVGLGICSVVFLLVAGYLKKDHGAKLMFNMLTVGRQEGDALFKNHQYLTTVSLDLGLLLAFTAIVGFFSSNRLETMMLEEKRAERSFNPFFPSGYALISIYLGANFLSFIVFVFSAFWFIVYDKGPVSPKTAEPVHGEMNLKGNSTLTTSGAVIEQKGAFVEKHIGFLLILIGVFCGYVAFLLFSTLQLTKKILRRMMKLNSLVQIQTLCLALFSLALLLVLRYSVDFGHFKARDDDLFKHELPKNYSTYFQWAGVSVLVVAFVGFMASNTENILLMKASAALSAFLLVGLLGLGLMNQFIENLIEEKVGSHCMQVLPVFSNYYLVQTACDAKYATLTTKLSDLSTCPNHMITTVWEENVRTANMDKYSPPDEKLFACLNEDCCPKLQHMLADRLSLVSALCFVGAIAMSVHIVNSHYMTKIRQRYNYQVKIFEHSGDYLNLAILLVLSAGYFYLAVIEGE